jgi:hypothetical protein
MNLLCKFCTPPSRLLLLEQRPNLRQEISSQV